MSKTYSIELDRIRQDSEQRRDEFDVMRYQLQYDDDLDDTKLDAFVESIAQPIIEAIDCTACGNCCRSLDVYLDEVDVERLAEGLEQPKEAIQETYVNQEKAQKDDEWGMFRARPCAFLDGKRCSVYTLRPQSCRDYPVFTPYFRWIMTDMLDGASICPIIYHVLDAMSQHVDAIVAGNSPKI
jgi:Fe-S-cluster containining protein